MRNLKKFLALVMAMVMAMSLMVTANAAVTANKSYPDSATADPAFDEAITVLSGMGVFSGDNGSFYPTRNVTRAEAAALVYRLATGDVNDTQNYLYAKYGNFPDVKEDAWYAGYVGYCANKGLIKGRPDGTFDASGNVTGYEILAMILRAVGYDQNGEFTGPDWQVNVSALSQKLGVIANVNSTQYGGTLYLPAERQVVADLLFQTDAYIPMVNYTAAFGYQPYGNEGGVTGAQKNETLGQKIFGLTWNNGVVVGNEVTGEAEHVTKIGFSLDTIATNAIGATWVWTDDTDHTQGGRWDNNVIPSGYTTEIDNTLGIGLYKGSAYVYDSDDYALPENVTRAFKWDSDLRLFNHAVKVWYDNRGSQYVTVGNRYSGIGTKQFTTNLTTYAVFDELKHDDHDGSRAIIETNAHVVAIETTTENTAASLGTVATPGNLYAAATSGTPSRANNWNAPGFTVNYDWNGAGANAYYAYYNYSFGPITYSDYLSTPADVSPVMFNDGTEAYGLYLLIANGSDKSLDVVIPLQMTFTKITQSNSTTEPYTVGVYNENGAGTAYFDTWDIPASGTNNYTNIAQANLRGNSVTTLGTNVAAIQITGTAPGDAARLAATRNGSPLLDGDGVTEGNAEPVDIDDDNATADNSSYYYQLTENKLTKDYTVVAINPNNQTLTMSDGSTLKQSIFAEDVDATFTKQIEGVDKTTSPYTKVLKEGSTYTFTLDEQGNYIYWTTPRNTNNFVYGTYIDFTTKLASGAFDYPMVYVSANGEGKLTENITKVDGVSMSAALYDTLELPKRDNAAAGNDSGYEKGFYFGYAMKDGVLTSIGKFGTTNAAGEPADEGTGFWQASATDFGAAQYDAASPKNGTLIDKTAVELGSVQVPGATGIDYFLTNNTQFYVVSGAGTASQKVTPYKGLAELKGDYTSVIINVSAADSPLKTASDYLADADGTSATYAVQPYDMVYFKFARTDYAQDYMGSAYEIGTVFLPEEALKRNADESSSLYFVGSKRQTNISAVGENATQFTMYNDKGEKGSYWIKGYITDTTMSPAKVIDTNGNNVFYQLVATNDKAADGGIIYTIRNVSADNQKKVIGQFYNGYTAAGDTYAATKDWSNIATDPASQLTSAATYAATTRNSQVAFIDDTLSLTTSPLYNVQNATVVNLNTGVYSGVSSVPTLNDAGSLADNTGVPVSCVITGRIVDVIFVNAP